MKKAVLILITILIYVNAYTQCTTCTNCSNSSTTGCTYTASIANGNLNSNFTVSAGEKLCIQDGTYTGTVTMRTGTVVVGTGSTFNGTLSGFFGGSQGGTFEVHSGATATLNGISTNTTTFTINNCGTLTMNGALGTFNGTVNINNVGRLTSAFNYTNNTTGTTCNGGYMEFVNFSSSKGIVINQDSLIITGNTITNSDDYTLCPGSLIEVQGNFSSTNGNFTGTGVCAFITVAGTSQCSGCDLFGDLDFCAVGAVNPVSNPTFSNTATGTIEPSVTQCSSCNLPLEMGSIKVNCSNNGNVINWFTYSEVNNNFFTIERSDDGKKFAAIAKIKGAGNSSEIKDYKYTVSYNDNSYYRIKQTDFDGKFSYSKVVKGACGLDNRILIYPNPVRTLLNIDIRETKVVLVTIYSALGQKIYSERITDSKSTIDIQNFKKGIYILKISGNDINVTQKIVMN